MINNIIIMLLLLCASLDEYIRQQEKLCVMGD